MRKVDDGEKRKKREKNGENSGPLTSLPVDRLKGDRLQRRPLVPKKSVFIGIIRYQISGHQDKVTSGK